ncbi:DUF4136 domain-containing protein [Hydrogenimonas sp.]
MIRRTFLLFGLLLLAGCSSLQVSSDYDPEFDFSRLRKAAILYPESKDDVITLAQQRFAAAIEEELKRKGFTVTDRRHADFLVLFHLNVTERRQLVTDYEMVGLYPYAYYPHWYGGYGMAVPVTREYTWTEGKFVVDVIDPKGNRIVWRGVATDRLKEFDTPQERAAYIRQVVAQVLKNFPPHTSQPQGEK